MGKDGGTKNKPKHTATLLDLGLRDTYQLRNNKHVVFKFISTQIILSIFCTTSMYIRVDTEEILSNNV